MGNLQFSLGGGEVIFDLDLAQEVFGPWIQSVDMSCTAQGVCAGG